MHLRGARSARAARSEDRLILYCLIVYKAADTRALYLLAATFGRALRAARAAVRRYVAQLKHADTRLQVFAPENPGREDYA